MKIRKKNCGNEHEVNIGNYLTKKKTRAKKTNTKKFFFFSLLIIKLEQKVLILNQQCINKNAFHKHKHLIDIDKVDIDKIVISNMVKKVHLNISLAK